MPGQIAKLEADKSQSYEEFAEEFLRVRNPSIGIVTVREWCRGLARGAAVLDLGCGNGVPISQVLIEAEFSVYGVDASRKMIHAFRERFPQAQSEWCAVEDSGFFDRTFDGIVAWGLLFLLPEATQAAVMVKVAKALNPGGLFLFTAPLAAVRWKDSITKIESVSLGKDSYEKLLRSQEVNLLGNALDEGGNHYYFCRKT